MATTPIIFTEDQDILCQLVRTDARAANLIHRSSNRSRGYISNIFKIKKSLKGFSFSFCLLVVSIEVSMEVVVSVEEEAMIGVIEIVPVVFAS
jgi:hypothetical protein